MSNVQVLTIDVEGVSQAVESQAELAIAGILYGNVQAQLFRFLRRHLQ